MEELERLAEEERLGAIAGLVELMDESGRITQRHIDDLSPEDRTARIRVEGGASSGSRIGGPGEHHPSAPPPASGDAQEEEKEE